MKKDPFISVIIPVKNLTYLLLHECLPELAKQTYKKYEVIILPNESSQYDLVLLKLYKNLRIVPTGTITRPAQKRDMGVQEAKGEVIAFLDDDAYPHPKWLEEAAKLFKKHNIEAVCGPGALPASSNTWEKIFDEVLKTGIGAGGFSYRFTPRAKRYVTDYPSMNFLIRKEVFQKLGGFNSNYWPGEDSKLCNDLIEKEKGKILYSPDVLVYHHRRKDLKGYLKQHGRYGFHRGAFFAHGDENSRNIAYLIPSFFLAYLISLPIFLLIGYTAGFLSYSLTAIILSPLALYCSFLLYLMLKSLLTTEDLLVSLGAPMVLFLTHAKYGLMFLKGFKKGQGNNENIYE